METYRLALEYVQDYILGGRADFIVSDINNSNHINFHVKQDKKDKSVYFVRYVGIETTYIGLIKTELKTIDGKQFNIPEFKPKQNLPITPSEKAEIFRKLILYIYYLNRLPRNIEILYTGKCSICGRKLTDPTYIEIGIGKQCLENYDPNFTIK